MGSSYLSEKGKASPLGNCRAPCPQHSEVVGESPRSLQGSMCFTVGTEGVHSALGIKFIMLKK